MKHRRISDTVLENIIKILSEEETGGFTIDAMMQISSELNKRLTSVFFHPIIKQAPRVIKANTNLMRSLAWSPDSQKILSGSHDGIEIWDAHTGKQIGASLWGNNSVVGTQSTVQPHEGAQASLPQRFSWHTRILDNMAWSPDGQRIVYCSGNTIIISDAHTGKQIGEPLRGHHGWVNNVAWSPDGQKIVSGSRDQTVRIWDAQTGKQIGNCLKGHKDDVSSVAWSPDGQRIVSGSDDYTVRIWDTQTRKQIGKCLKGHISMVVRVMWSPDSQMIVSGDLDDTVIIWDAITREQIIKSLNGHTFNSVWCMAWSPDSQRIVYGNRDRILRIWDVQSAKQIGASLRGKNSVVGTRFCHTDWVWCVAWSPDGQRIISGSRDATVRIWLL